MSRLSERLSAVRERGEKSMGLFLTSGFPGMSDTLPILDALGEVADFIELGMPFSDPLGEGPPIQRSSARALKGGIRMRDTFRFAREFTRRHATPLVLMGYINPILRYGPRQFCVAARQAGVNGLIIPDLPPEEDGVLAGHAAESGLDIIYLVAPNTPRERIRDIDARSSGFVYAVSVTGVTGIRLAERMNQVEKYLRLARSLVRKNPLLVGFGIRTHSDAVRLCRHTDGFIVGSALVTRIEQLWRDESLGPKERCRMLREFAVALKFGQ